LKIAIILNGVSRQKNSFYTTFLPKLSSRFKVDVFETQSKHDAVTLADDAVKRQYDVILAAGGDGTVNQVVNGILSDREYIGSLPVVGIIPIGSGNDFARSLRIQNKAEQLVNLLENFSPTKIDIGKVIYTKTHGKGGETYFVNVADIGMGPEVVKRVQNDNHTFSPSISYYKSILLTFFMYRPVFVTGETKEWKWKGKTRSLAIANGKFYGHGLCVAPDSKPNDGIFSAFICGDVSVFDFIRYSGKLKNEKKINHPEIHYRETNEIHLQSENLCLIEADGELLGQLPARIEMASAKLSFIY